MKPKALLFLSMFMMLTPSFLYWFGPLNRPAMADGDKLTTMPCPECHGSGANCPRCRGKKEVKAVLPGPNRPTYVVGHVYAPDQAPVANANVHIEPVGNRKTDEKGMFGADLPPGSYPISIDAPAGKLQGSIEVPIRTAPEPVDREVTFPTRHEAFQLH